MNRVKKHFQDHREFYYGAATVLTIVGVGVLIHKKRIPVSTQTPSVVVNNVVNNSYEPAKRLSYIIQERGTNNFWTSQSDLARDLGTSEANLSKYFNHGGTLKGITRDFDRIGVAS